MMAADKTFKPTLFGFSMMQEVTKNINRLSALSNYPHSHFCCKSLFHGASKMIYIKALLEGKDEKEAAEAAVDGVGYPATPTKFMASMNSTTERIQNYVKNQKHAPRFEDLPPRIKHPELPENVPMEGVSRLNDARVAHVFQIPLLNIAKDVHAVMIPQSGLNDTATGKGDVDSFVSDIARAFYKSKRCHPSFNQLVSSMTCMKMMKVTKAQKIVVRLLLLRGIMRAADPYDCSAPADLVQYYTRPLHDGKYGLPKVAKVP